MPTAADAATLQLILADLATEAIADLVALWRKYSDDPEFAALLLAAFPEIIGPYTQAGGLFSAQWYTELAPDLAYTAEPFVDLPADRQSRSVKWALYAPVEMRVPEDFVPQEPVAVKAQPSPELVLSRLSGSVKRMIYDSSRQTVLHNLATEYGDPPGGSFDDEPGTRWARYASANACSFCRMLATRAAVYRSRESAERVTGRSVDITTADRRQIAAGLTTRDEALARRTTYSNARAARKAGKSVGDRKTGRLRGTSGYGSKYHDHCRCIAVPVRPGTSYEPPDYVNQWDDDYIAATRAVRAAGEDTGGKGELNAILREMDARSRDRRQGISTPPIEMVEIELAGAGGEKVTKRVPADSPAARAYAKRSQEDAPPTASGNSGGPPKPPGGPPAAAAGDRPDGWSGHGKNYQHPHGAPKWTESERVRRQEALGAVPPGEQLYQHEIESVERMQALGQQLIWIKRTDAHATNDATWINQGIAIELKSTKAKQSSINQHIVDCFKQAEDAAARGHLVVKKENFVIDIGQSALTDKLRNQLAKFNERRRGHIPPRRVKRLWVLTQGQLVEIPLA